MGKEIDRTFPSRCFFLLPNTLAPLRGMESPRKVGVPKGWRDGLGTSGV